MKKPDPQLKKLFERTIKQQSRKVNFRLANLKKKSSKKTNKNRIDCRKCNYFFITWEKSTPYGCRAHGFKSAQIPSQVVFNNSGKQCLYFSPVK